MSINFTVRLPKELVEKMKKYREVNWSEVVRTAIEEHLRRLEELRIEEPALEALERLKRLGVSKEDLQPMSLEIEKGLRKTLEKEVEERRELLRRLEGA